MKKNNNASSEQINQHEFIERFGGDIVVLSREESISNSEVIYQLSIANKEVTLPLSEINTTRRVMNLAKYGLEIFEEDAEDVLAYLKYKIRNSDYPVEKVTMNIGYINSQFVNPFISELKVVNSDPGFKKYYNAFGVSGNIVAWNEKVLQTYKDSPACMFYLIAALASVIIQHLGLSPFIVDINSETSTGKTTLTEAAISTFGHSNMLMNWSATSYGIEKVASAANNFPLFFDDTKKANKKSMQQNIYNFTSGESKTRGNGRMLQEISRWCNILLSTGEYSILQFTEGAGGAAARCISLQFDKEPMNKIEFAEFKKSYQENYGVIGLEFLNKWTQALKEDKNFKKSRHLEISIQLTENITNNVLGRLADSFASVILTAELLNEWFSFNIDIDQFFDLFIKMAESNQEVDMPKKLLLDILEEIDAKRDYLGKYNGNYYVNKDELCFTKEFLKKKLGEQALVIRKIWLKQGLVNKHVINGQIVEYKRGYVKIEGKINHPTVITMNLSLIEELGFLL